jgi:hypothetical protein
MGWINVDDIEITDSVNSIHVDTRDFLAQQPRMRSVSVIVK